MMLFSKKKIKWRKLRNKIYESEERGSKIKGGRKKFC